MEETCVFAVQKTKDAPTPGIVYLSRIPSFMSVIKIRNVFGQYGEIGKVFLQPEKTVRKGKKVKCFTEGWIEFLNKKIAKRVAVSLNSQRVGDKKRSRWYDETWSLKYLSKFQWGHLNERLAYEKAARQHKMAAEIAQAKREAEFYVDNVQKQKQIASLDKKKKDSSHLKRNFEYKQKELDEDIIAKKRKPEGQPVDKPKGNVKVSLDILQHVFTGGVD